MTVRAVRHVGIVVADMEQALRFWRDTLGLRVQADADEHGPFLETVLAEPGVRVRTVKLAAGEGPTLVELLQFAAGGDSGALDLEDLRRPGPTHVALTVADVDALLEPLRDAGARFRSAPQVSVDGRAKVAFCAAPDGVMLELVEPLA
jgi:glyoxylase I family protein